MFGNTKKKRKVTDINIEEDDYKITTKLLDEPLLSLENITYDYQIS